MRNRKKQTIRARKALFGVSAPETGASSEDSLQTESIATQSESEKQTIRARKALFCVSAPETGASSEGSLQTESIATQSESESESLPGEHRFDADIKEVELIRAKEAQKEAILQEKYSHYQDSSECFADDRTPLFIPDNVDRFIRIPIVCQMRDMRERENRALLSARIYRNRCSTLRRRIRELEEEKEGVRYFWRNQVLEGQSRGGSMLKLSLEKQCD